ncbi:acyltransferase [Actimicrobium sp. CCC2.4]|uniref:acyltransferase n=1 Tax=Actimicrobium sp. CCC2.4 TaxID=3048606 RepID=UPI002AC9BA17|nr:acyltransferase [Actimicrobium sp. CCC2.4]MEB0136927.1 acyltransferase [Actimicrobium sp. CCC2.4]WPX32704.1 acyltransferase [Actimicrobium sp. CCC2.4]
MRRIESVEIFRLIAITAVIAIHVQPFQGFSFENGSDRHLFIIINQLARFAVPFFFVVSGYFWGIKIRNAVSSEDISYPMMKKIFMIFVFWSIIYVLPYNIFSISEIGWYKLLTSSYWKIRDIYEHPVRSLMEGSKVYLWFFVALLYSVGISQIFLKYKLEGWLIFFAIALYLFGVFAKAYSETSFGIRIQFDTRNGPFFGTIFFVTGYFLSRYNPTNRWFILGIGCFLFGTVLHFIELYVISRIYGGYLVQDFCLGTYFMGVGVAIAALSNCSFLRNRVLQIIGKFTLGIYASHFLFIEMLGPIRHLYNSAFWEIAFVSIVLTLSIVFVITLSKINTFRSFVQ